MKNSISPSVVSSGMDGLITVPYREALLILKILRRFLSEHPKDPDSGSIRNLADRISMDLGAKVGRAAGG